MALRTDHPELAADVALYEHPRGVLVRLARRRSTFLIGALEARMLLLCDGSRDVAQLKQDAAALMTGRQVEKFLLLVESHGMLATDEPLRNARGSLLQWRLFSFPLANIFTGGPLGRLLARAIYFSLLPALALLGWTLGHHGRDALRQVVQVHYTSWSTAAVLAVSVLLIGALHEAAHGVTIASHGGRVFEVGMLLNYGMPSFFVDVSGVELLPSLGHRIQVWMAGIAAQSSLLSLGLFLQVAGFTPGWLRSDLLIVNAVNLTLISMNSLFFIKMDGYFIAQELLAIKPLNHAGLGWLTRPATAPQDPLECATGILAAVFISGYVPLFLANLVTSALTRLGWINHHTMNLTLAVGVGLALVLNLTRLLYRTLQRRRLTTRAPMGDTLHVRAA